MIQEYQLRASFPEIAANEQRLKEYLSEEKGLNLRNINATRILKRSIDARQRTIFVNLKIRVYINETPEEDEYDILYIIVKENHKQLWWVQVLRIVCSSAPYRTRITPGDCRTRKRCA